jgi:hypothetical protein
MGVDYIECRFAELGGPVSARGFFFGRTRFTWCRTIPTLPRPAGLFDCEYVKYFTLVGSVIDYSTVVPAGRAGSFMPGSRSHVRR